MRKSKNHHRAETEPITQYALFARAQEIIRAIIRDEGGDDGLSTVRLQLIRRFGVAAALTERMERRLASGDADAVSHHALLCNSMLRIAQLIGLGRRFSSEANSLRDYLRCERSETSQ